MKSRECYEEEEREALEAWREEEELQARLDLPKRQRGCQGRAPRGAQGPPPGLQGAGARGWLEDETLFPAGGEGAVDA